MKAIYCLDHRFVADAGGATYSTGAQFDSDFWTKLLHAFPSLVVLGRQGKLEKATNLAGVSGARFELLPNLSSLQRGTSRSVARQMIFREFDNRSVLIARLPSQVGLLGIAEARRAGVPYAVELAGCPWDGYRHYGTWKGKAYAPIMAWRVREAVKAAPYVLYVTKKFLQARYPNHGGITTACSNVDIAIPTRSVLVDRLESIGHGTPTALGLIGTLSTRYKGIQTVLAALAHARDRIPPVEFRVLGPGDSKPWVAEAKRLGVDDLVRFDGPLAPGDQVMSWLDGLDIYLQPSFKEGLPRALIEAMSRGLPAIASRAGGIPELLEPDCLIRPGDSRHLAKLITNAVEDQGWQRRQAIRNWERAGEYSRDKLDARRQEFWAGFAEYAQRVNAMKETR